MFEFGIAKKYLLPTRKHLSRSLISVMSVGVITLVVWLVLLFLSVNEGIQKRWLDHLTQLNAPLQIVPKPAYYSSYYYRIDEYAEQSAFSNKTLREKLASEVVDPFNPQTDPSLPRFFPQPDRTEDGKLKNLVPELFDVLSFFPQLVASEYEVAAGVLKLSVMHYDPESPARLLPHKSLVSQAAYLKSFGGEVGTHEKLLSKVTTEDVEKLIGTLERLGRFKKEAPRIFSHLSNLSFTTIPDQWSIPKKMLPKGIHPCLYDPVREECILDAERTNATLIREDTSVFVVLNEDAQKHRVRAVKTAFPLILTVSAVDYAHCNSLEDIQFTVRTALRNQPLEGVIPWKGVTLSEATALSQFKEKPEIEPMWPYMVLSENKVHLPSVDGYSTAILPKTLRTNGARVGDIGRITYASTTVTSLQEQERPLFTVGFYDPGAINLGIRFILTNPDLVSELNAAATNVPIDGSLKNGIHIWHPDIKNTKQVKEQLENALEAHGLSQYFAVQAFYDYDQVKDLLQQFQSDQYLFSLVGIIILFVACTNIITLSVLLVNDKKKEIGILRAMGAKTGSVALIFGLCGALMGLVSTALGVGLALITLLNIDSLISLLSSLSGQPLFAEAFYGTTLPNTLSTQALLFVGIMTPLIALGAGLVPAIKACRLKTADILRGEG